MSERPSSPIPAREPVFNLPTVVTAILAVLVGVHVLRTLILDPSSDFAFVLTFAFIPARLTEPRIVGLLLPGGGGAMAWSFVTYALLHADWAHLVFNSLWLAAFGSPLAWRFGPTRFIAFSLVGAVAGAVLHLAIYPGSMTPLVGASAAISAHMAGASRFIFTAGGPLGGLRRRGLAAYQVPAPDLAEVLGDARVMGFLAIWFGLNLFFGLFGGGAGLASGAIAWEAHVGGFLAGLFLFPFFDPVPALRRL